MTEHDIYRRLWGQAGLWVEHERDRREFGIEFFSRMRASWTYRTPPLGPPIVLGPDFATKVANLIAARQRGLLAPTEMINAAAGG